MAKMVKINADEYFLCIGYIDFSPSTPIALNKSPLSFNEHGVPCVPEHGAFKLHPWFISDAFGFTINLTAVQTSIATKNVNRSSLCLDH